MSDIFISYRNTPERRAVVRRLAAILRAHDVSVWWDYGLEAGESYRSQISEKLARARLVVPLWCAESVASKWVLMEAEMGRDKLVPARLQKVAPPSAFEAIQAADLVGWDGAISHPRLQAFVRRLCDRLGKPFFAPPDMVEELSELPRLTPLPDAQAASGSTTGDAVRDFAFWKGEWEAHRDSADLAELRAIAKHAPAYFAGKADARIAEIERQASTARQHVDDQDRLDAYYRAGGHLKIDASLIHGAPEGWLLPGNGRSEWFKDHGLAPEMVVVPAGRFMMGEGSNRRSVTIEAPFAVGRFAVTFDNWDAALAAGGLNHHPNDRGWGRGKQPAINVSWDDANAYVAWLCRVTGQTYSLLSEAQWEYCCRAGTTTAYWWGDDISTEQANYNGHYTVGRGVKGEYRQRPVTVDQFRPNPWGLYQVHGNVWEWVGDRYDADNRLLRGGSWSEYPQSLRCAYRYWPSGDPRQPFRVPRR